MTIMNQYSIGYLKKLLSHLQPLYIALYLEINHQPVAMKFYRISPLKFGSFVTLTDRDGLANGMNNVVLTAWDFDRPTNNKAILPISFFSLNLDSYTLKAI